MCETLCCSTSAGQVVCKRSPLNVHVPRILNALGGNPFRLLRRFCSLSCPAWEILCSGTEELSAVPVAAVPVTSSVPDVVVAMDGCGCFCTPWASTPSAHKQPNTNTILIIVRFIALAPLCTL